jgi:hyperosmotically inducible protein
MGVTMKRRLQVLVVLLVVFPSARFAGGQIEPSSPDQTRIAREVRHELLMLPYFGVFDNIEYRVDGNTVTLYGAVTRPVLKSDAENVVKHIEGVENVVNKIDVLPPSPTDDQLRLALFRTIYEYPALEKYALGVQKPIRIIVKNGHVALEGVVDNDTDKNLAGMRANGVPGVFSVTNNAQSRSSLRRPLKVSPCKSRRDIVPAGVAVLEKLGEKAPSYGTVFSIVRSLPAELVSRPRKHQGGVH